jgi:hypothetical protein
MPRSAATVRLLGGKPPRSRKVASDIVHGRAAHTLNVGLSLSW